MKYLKFEIAKTHNPKYYQIMEGNILGCITLSNFTKKEIIEYISEQIDSLENLDKEKRK